MYETNLEANKENAIEFYRTAYLGDPSKAVEKYVGAEYIQHNPVGGELLIHYSDQSFRWPSQFGPRS